MLTVVHILFLIPAQRKGANEISSTTECPNSTRLPQTETGKHTYTLLIMEFSCNFYFKIFGKLGTKSSMSNEQMFFCVKTSGSHFCVYKPFYNVKPSINWDTIIILFKV